LAAKLRSFFGISSYRAELIALLAQLLASDKEKPLPMPWMFQ
jgi:hypothetical protein